MIPWLLLVDSQLWPPLIGTIQARMDSIVSGEINVVRSPA
jgi:hypothetical protein